MRIRRLDNAGDWAFGRGRADYLTGQKAVAQNIQTRVRFFVNDWFLDMGYGIDWLFLLGNRGTDGLILRRLETTILGTFGVTTLDALTIETDRRTRKISIQYRVGTLFDTEVADFVEVLV